MKTQNLKTQQEFINAPGEYIDNLPHYSLYLNVDDIHANYTNEEKLTHEDFFGNESLNEVGKNFNEEYFI